MTSEKRNILLITSWYPSPENPTYGIFVKEQAQLFVKRGHQVTVLDARLTGTFFQSIGKNQKVVSETIESGIRVFRIYVKPVLPKMRKLSYDHLAKKSFNYLKTHLDLTKVDVVHAHSTFLGGYIANYINTKLDIPYVLTEHASALIFNPKSLNQTDRSIFKKSCDGASSLIFVSSFQKEEIRKNYNLSMKNACIVPNLVDDIFFENQDRRNDNKAMSFLAIGSCIPVKQFLLLLEAWQLVLQQKPELRLTIAGDGPLKNDLVSHSDQLGITNSLNWMNHLSRASVLAQIEMHDVLISSSKIETFGLTVAEAVSCGKPVVVTNSGGVVDIVNKRNGIIVEQSSEKLAEGILDMIENYGHFNSEEICKEALGKYGSEAIYDQLMQIYSTLQS